MTVDFNYPQIIDANTPAVAAEVQSNFDALLSWIKINYRQKDDTPLLTVMPTLPGTPVNDQHAATKAYVDAAVPTSTILEFAGAVLPDDTWLWCDGAAYSVTAEPALFDVIGTLYNVGGETPDTFRVPNKKGRVSVGFDAATAPFNTQGAVGGKRDSELFAHVHSIPAHKHTAAGTATTDSHSHTMTHDHANATAAAAGAHSHTATHFAAVQTGGGLTGLADGAVWGSGVRFGPMNPLQMGSSTQPAHTHTVNIPGFTGATLTDSHTHTLTITTSDKAAFDTVTAGAGTTLVDKNLQPYIVMRYIIKAR